MKDQDSLVRMTMLLTAKQLSEMLNMNLSTVYLWAAQGKIPCLRIYESVRFEPEVIQQWLKQFAQADAKKTLSQLTHSDSREVDQIVAAAKRSVYTPRHGETRPKSGLIQKEEDDGPV